MLPSIRALICRSHFPRADCSSRSFWACCAPWAPYISPTTDTFDQLRQRSPLLLFCLLAVSSRFHDNPAFAHFAEQQALTHMRNTLYSTEPPKLADLKGSLLYNAWMSRGAPPGHSVSLALQLELPGSLKKLISALALPMQQAKQAFEAYMPSVRTWLSLYCQEIW